MKQLKKVGAIVLALCMCMSLCVTAFAESRPVGSIEIKDTAPGETYSIYQIFELTYSDGEQTSYSYKLVDDWYGFFENYPNWDQYFTLIEVGGNDYSIAGQYDEGAEYYLDPNSLIFSEDCDIDLAEFAKAALDYASENNIESTATAVAGYENAGHDDSFMVDEEGNRVASSVLFENLSLGWYLVDSSVGTLCMLTSTDPDAVIYEKNAEPTVDKYVSNVSYGESTERNQTEDEADNNDYLEYKLVIHDVGNVTNLVIHDYMDEQLDLNSLVIKEVILYSSAEDTEGEILHRSDEVDGGFFVDVEGFTLTITDGACTNPDCGLESCSFEIAINDSLLDGLSNDAYIVIVYDVHLVEGMEDYDGDLVDEIDNWVGLTYGNASHSTPTETETYSFGFGVFKYTYTESGSYTKSVRDVLAVTVKEGGYYVVGCHDIGGSGQRYYKDDYDVQGNMIYATEGANDYANIAQGTVLYLEPGTYYFVNLDTWDYAGHTDFELIPVTLSSSGSAQNVDDSRETLALMWQLPLSGAEFVLSKKVDGVTYYAVFERVGGTHDTAFGDDLVADCYMLIGWTTEENEATVIVSDSDGNILVEGLKDGTYSLTEVAAPDGYNKLAESLTIVISDNGSVSVNGDSASDKVVNVENKMGTELPGTGGIGTTIFYIVGAILICGAVVVLVTRRRMNRA